MAEKFGSDPVVAARMASELGTIRSDMTSMGKMFAGYAGATGSQLVESALEDFYTESSDSREAMDALLERAAGLLRGLADGTVSTDNGLAQALVPHQPAQPAPGNDVEVQPLGAGR